MYWKEIIATIYKDKGEYLIDELIERYALGKVDADNEQPQWYKTAQMYSVYPDAFYVEGVPGLRSLTTKLDHIKALGMNVVHLLPFLESPMVDIGFDVSDYCRVREELGGDDAMEDFLREMKRQDLHLIMDLVLNHTSEKHGWFQKGLAGDEKYRSFYYHVKDKPELLDYFQMGPEQWAKYKLPETGKEIQMRILFPDQVGDLPHWIQKEDGYWYYHTFYPQQLDVNWLNPDVFLAYVDVIKYWAEKGVHFRLDAVPFLAKNIGEGETESGKHTHLLVQLLHILVRHFSSNSVFLVEANQQIPVTKSYMGTDEHIESELAYNFHLTQAIWACLIEEIDTYIWRILDQSYPIPAYGQWVTLLRNHDQLSYEFASLETREIIHADLLEKGLEMTGIGISGRTASFLDGNVRRILMANALIASLPGIPTIIYGDEIGKENDYRYMKGQTEIKRRTNPQVSDDTRDINRGFIFEEDFSSEQAGLILEGLKYIFGKRQEFREIAVLKPERIETEIEGVLALRYNCKGKILSMYINLSEVEKSLSVGLNQELVMEVNQSRYEGERLVLPGFGVAWLSKVGK